VEHTIVSAARTAASAVLAADRLTGARGRPRRIGFLGAGPSARFLSAYLAGAGWTFDTVAVHGPPGDRAAGLGLGSPAGRISVAGSAEQLVRTSDLVVLAAATSGPRPIDPSWFAHHPLVLHLCAPDHPSGLGPDAVTVVDHLGPPHPPTGTLVHATLHSVLTGRFVPDGGRPLVFSPFGSTALDRALARHVHDAVEAAGELVPTAGFFDNHRHPGLGGTTT
jgi:ornithine cyclodeaminase